MTAAIISFAAVALAFAGAAVALAMKGSAHKVDAILQLTAAKEAQHNADSLREQLVALNELRGADFKQIKSQKDTIDQLRKLLSEHAPDGVAAKQFDWMLQEASGEDSDQSSDGGESLPR